MTIISPYALINSMRTVNKWQASINANLVGATKIGYKEMDVMFGGGSTSTIVPQRGNQLGVALAEDTIRVGHTSINFKQGELLKSTSDDHYAIDGQGFFMVADKTGKIYYTRNGEFYDNGLGQLMNTEGLILVDRAVAINLGLYTAPALTIADIDNDDTGWVNMPASSAWLPYVAGTKYEEAGSYQNMTVNAKKTFFMNGNDITGSETISLTTDNEGYVIVNGNLLTAADVTNGNPYPTDWGTTTILRIGPYLVPGANTIVIQATEHVGGETINLSADTVTNVNLTTSGANRTTWAVEISPYGTVAPAFSPAPTDSQKKNILSTDLKDMILALPPALQDLVYSSFSALYFDDPIRTVASTPKSLPDQNDFGRVLKNTLESSNVNMARNLTNLTGVKSMSDVIAKQFSTFIAQVDIGINLIV